VRIRERFLILNTDPFGFLGRSMFDPPGAIHTQGMATLALGLILRIEGDMGSMGLSLHFASVDTRLTIAPNRANAADVILFRVFINLMLGKLGWRWGTKGSMTGTRPQIRIR
jgi:hypothetical protein